MSIACPDRLYVITSDCRLKLIHFFEIIHCSKYQTLMLMKIMLYKYRMSRNNRCHIYVSKMPMLDSIREKASGLNGKNREKYNKRVAKIKG